MRRLLPFLSLWFFVRASDLDGTLLSNKQKPSSALAPAPAELDVTDTVEDTEETDSVTSKPVAPVPDSPDAIVQSGESSCQIRLCHEKTDRKGVSGAPKEPIIPDWFKMYRHNYLDSYVGIPSPKQLPTWSKVKWCIAIKQEETDTKVVTALKGVPAGRRYFLVVGNVVHGKPEDWLGICDSSGDETLIFRYIIDFFLTGDDFTDLDSYNSDIDHMAPARHKSKVNFRLGRWEFEGDLLSRLAAVSKKNRIAYWWLDATLLEFVDAVSLANENDACVPPHKLLEHGKGQVFTNPLYIVQLYFAKRRPGYDQWPKNSFFHSAAEGFSILKHQRELRDGDDDFKLISDVKIDEKVYEYSWAPLHPHYVSSFHLSGCVPWKDLPHIKLGGQFGHSEMTLKLPGFGENTFGYLGAKHVATSSKTRELTTLIFTYKSFGEQFELDKYSLYLPMVACGLFPKALPHPKKCKKKGLKFEREVAV